MRKLILVVAVLFALSGVSYSDSARYIGLGSPIVIKDTALIGTYPSKILQFPNSVFGTISSGSPVYMGVAIVNESRTLGVMGGFYSSGRNFVDSWGTPIDGTSFTPYGDFAVAIGNWGILLGGMVNVENLNYYSINDNTSNWTDGSGLAFSLRPSVTLEVGDAMELSASAYLAYRNVNIDYYNASGTNNVNASGLVKEGLNGLLVIKGSKFDFGFNLLISRYSESVFLNASSSTNTNENKQNMIYAGAGFRYKASSAMKFYGNVKVGMYESFSSTTTKLYTLPSLMLSSEIDLGKGWIVRGGGSSEFTINVFIDASGEKHSVSKTSSYFLGMGYKRLPFVINAVIQNTFLTGGPTIVSGAAYASGLYSRLSLNYVF